MRSQSLAGVLTLVFSQLVAAAPATEVSIDLVVRESRETYSSSLRSFQTTVKSSDGVKAFECRDDRVYVINMGQDIYGNGWNPDLPVIQDSPGLSLELASCRSAELEILGWFPKKNTGYSVSNQFMVDTYNPNELPLLLRLRSATNEIQYFSCHSPFVKTLKRRTDTFEEFNVKQVCQPTSLGNEKTGPVDFITNPSAYAAVAGYRSFILPWASATSDVFERVVDELVNKIPVGKYKGIMTTNAKTCEVNIERQPGKLTVTHTATATARPIVQKREFTVAGLLGFAKGDVYSDPIRALPETKGTMAVAEFNKDSAASFYVMFEKRTDRDGLVARINGVTPFCRRLVPIQ